MKDTKHLIPPKDGVLVGPQPFVWINSNNLFALGMPPYVISFTHSQITYSELILVVNVKTFYRVIFE